MFISYLCKSWDFTFSKVKTLNSFLFFLLWPLSLVLLFWTITHLGVNQKHMTLSSVYRGNNWGLEKWILTVGLLTSVLVCSHRRERSATPMGSLGNALKLFWEWEGLYSQRYDVLHCTKSSPKRKISSPKIPWSPPGSNVALGDIDPQNVALIYGGFNDGPQESCWDLDKHSIHLPDH